jgi:hypothetical protein
VKDLEFVDVDIDVWLRAPSPWHLQPDGPSDEEWATRLTDAVWTGADPAPEAADRERTRRLLLAAGSREYPGPASGWAWKYLHLPAPVDEPVPALVAFLPPDAPREEALRSLVRADDPTCVEPPMVEEVETPIGTALRALAYHVTADADGEESLLATLSYAWRAEDPAGDPSAALDVRLWTGYTPDRVIAMADDVEQLARSLRWVDVPSETTG